MILSYLCQIFHKDIGTYLETQIPSFWNRFQMRILAGMLCLLNIQNPRLHAVSLSINGVEGKILWNRQNQLFKWKKLQRTVHQNQIFTAMMVHTLSTQRQILWVDPYQVSDSLKLLVECSCLLFYSYVVFKKNYTRWNSDWKNESNRKILS